ncbi:hypothetical protein N7509_008184 [Penicillium cosmopolitanum]|uniref:Rhodopsin domain-containing protein n=1 Tax=Penicillium cosmopolitanum TaxID=1131564 RepID=A0A9W9VM41_9EURO|nr:uncharacterized protein N7509_008184 [Penicillium cosmopolitanum]KAJ5385643.1 hypothetical protein N7509_008184 [Penicillium cosmopolitanum]
MVYIALSWIVIEIFMYAVWCHPVSDYWAVKVDNSVQCTTAEHHLIMSFVFNISSDIAMLFIPIPLIVRSKMSTLKKVLLSCTFGLGIFVVRHNMLYPRGCSVNAHNKQIACAIGNRVYSFANIVSIQWIYWYVREASTAVIVANIPNCYTLLRRILDALQCMHTEIVGRARQQLPHFDFNDGSIRRGKRNTSEPNAIESLGSSMADI